MQPSVLFCCVIALAAAKPTSAIPQQWQQYGVARRQDRGNTNTNTTTIPVFDYGPFSTVYVGGGLAADASNSRQPASKTATRSPAESTSLSAVPSTVAATGTIPTFDYFPSSTVLVDPAPTSPPSTGDGSNSPGSDGSGNSGSGAGDNSPGTGAATGDGSGIDPQTGLPQGLANLLEGLLNLLGD